MVAKAKDGAMRQAYTVRLKPELLRALKHLAVDENKTIGELIEEGIAPLLEKKEVKRKK
jgi:predicted transcriptional regulator